MQDTRTGKMIPLDVKDYIDRSGDFKARLADITRDKRFLGEKAGIPEYAQGPVFSIDEEVEIKGGRFRVRGFECGLLHLEGISKR